jgi:hypothetical protein
MRLTVVTVVLQSGRPRCSRPRSCLPRLRTQPSAPESTIRRPDGPDRHLGQINPATVALSAQNATMPFGGGEVNRGSRQDGARLYVMLG